MGRFMTHEPIFHGVFNRDYTGGTNVLAPWATELQNTKESLELMVLRMESDYAQTRPKMRKTWNLTLVDFWI